MKHNQDPNDPNVYWSMLNWDKTCVYDCARQELSVHYSYNTYDRDGYTSTYHRKSVFCRVVFTKENKIIIRLLSGENIPNQSGLPMFDNNAHYADPPPWLEEFLRECFMYHLSKVIVS